MTVASASFDIEGGDTACLGCAARSLLIATKRSGAKSSTAIDAWNFICFFDLYDVVVSLATLCRLPGYDSNGATVSGINSHQDFGNTDFGLDPKRPEVDHRGDIPGPGVESSIRRADDRGLPTLMSTSARLLA
ncbi:MAG TPA: hypothetical protein VHD36_19645 [Pirellulales bacterium]|nr:hypothetical protein [Pirellulales bacterium]